MTVFLTLELLILRLHNLFYQALWVLLCLIQLISEHKLSRCLIEMVIPTLADDGSEICP